MLTSARNQLTGTISAIQRGAVNDEVEIRLADGQAIVAVVTRGSTDSLGLAVGGAALALIKSSWIILMPSASGVRLSARNQLAGTVQKVQRGAVNSEVTLALPSGMEVVATITNDSATDLALVPGVAVTAAFKASSVIVGVEA